MYQTPDGKSTNGWDYSANSHLAHSPPVPLPQPTPASSSSPAFGSISPVTPLHLIDPTLRPPLADAPRTQGAPSDRVIAGKAGALLRFAEQDHKLSEIAKWQDKMKAGVEAKFKSLRDEYRNEIARLDDRYSEEVRQLHERLDRAEANMHHKTESESNGSDAEMIDMDLAEASLAATKDNNFLVSVIICLD
jgi:hypothetical protein